MTLKGRFVFGALAGALMTLGGLVPAGRTARPALRRVEPEAELVQQSQALATRIAAEYREMPGLCLTIPQAARLFGVSAQTAGELLGDLERDGVLRQSPDGRYRYADI